MSDTSLYVIFDTKYNEFISELKEVFPELNGVLMSAHHLSADERIRRYREEVLPVSGNPNRDRKVCPGVILPGVVLNEQLWNDVGEATHNAIHEYLTILSFCLLLNDGANVENLLPEGFNMDAMGDFMNMFKSKLSGIDFSNIAEKLGKLFQGAADVSGESAGGIPGFKLPEKFMNGHLARFAQEIVRDIKPEDFGLDASMLEQLEKNPSASLEILMNVFKSKPDFLQNSLKRVGKRIQAKVLSGEIRPQEIAREAEELMKEFINNPAFAELMESFRSMFGFEDMQFAKAAGKEGSARLAIVKDRLRKKMEAKKAAASGTPNTNALLIAQANAAANALLASESQEKKKNANKKRK